MVERLRAASAVREDEPLMEGGDAGGEEETAANQGKLLPEPEPEQPLSVGDNATVFLGPSTKAQSGN